MKTIVIFGSSWAKPEDQLYKDSQEIGRLLAMNNYEVMTGGYTGVMEAASRGANEGGGNVIGITTSQIESYRPLKANAWVKQEKKFDSLQERLNYLVANADGFVVMPGGIGTLSELSLVWSLMQIGAIRKGPIICYGPLWEKIIEDIINTEYVIREQKELVKVVGTVELVISEVCSYFRNNTTINDAK